jgi:predicted dienelactone hydrolase
MIALHRHAVASALVTVALAGSAAAQQLRNPEQPGPYPVGVTSMQFDDKARPDPELGPRPLRTEIWYPAVDAARSMPKNKYSDFIIGRDTVPGAMDAANEQMNYYLKGLTVAELEKTYKNISVRDVQVRDGRWPLIVFSHGSGGTRVGYVYLTEFLASHGFIVMAADHIGNSRYTIVNNQVVRSGGPRSQASAADRPKDVSFLIDSMTTLSGASGNRFSGKVDLDRIGGAGMSFGGSTTMRVLEQDTRVKAAVMLAPGGGTPTRANFTTPIFMMIGTEDGTIQARGNASNRQYYEQSKGPRYMMEIKDGGHFSFTSVDQYNANYGNGIGKGKRITVPDQDVTFLPMDLQHKMINAYALAFFGRYLRGETGYQAFLDKNHYGDVIIHKNGN